MFAVPRPCAGYVSLDQVNFSSVALLLYVPCDAAVNKDCNESRHGRNTRRSPKGGFSSDVDRNSATTQSTALGV
jgi:hypothetical protein